MPVMTIRMDLDQEPWTDLRDRADLVHTTEPIRVGVLPGGMESGKASVAIVVTLPDGRPVIAETSLDLFLAAATAFRARYGVNFPVGDDGDDA